MRESERKDTGDYGERIALSHLLKQGYSIVATNYTVFGGEIDIIAYKDRKDCKEKKKKAQGPSLQKSAPPATLSKECDYFEKREGAPQDNGSAFQTSATFQKEKIAPSDNLAPSASKISEAKKNKALQNTPPTFQNKAFQDNMRTPKKEGEPSQNSAIQPKAPTEPSKDSSQKKRGLLIFVEVKTLPHGNPETLERVLNHRKKRLLIKTAQLFLLKNRQYSESSVRFDVIAVDVPGLPRVYHIKGAFDGAND